MQNAIIYLSIPFLSLIQSTFNLGKFRPDLLLIFYLFFSLKRSLNRFLFLYFSFWQAIFSSQPFYFFLIFWLTLDIIVNFEKKRLTFAHRSFSFIILLSLSFFSIIYWNLNSLFNISLWKNLFFYLSSNLIVFLPLYFLLPKYLKELEYGEET